MNNETHFIIYQITNLVNGKIYIGKHKTNNLDDGYMGSGTLLKRAIRKYGIENFKKEILFECSSDEELFNKEQELVSEDFVSRDDTYNLKIGGDGGFDYINNNNLANSKIHGILGGLVFKQMVQNDKSLRKKLQDRARKTVKKIAKEHPEKFANFKYDWTGKHHTEETKKKISEKAKLRVGEKNNAFGTTWICNLELKENKKVKKELVDEYLRTGWILGRRMSFYKKG